MILGVVKKWNNMKGWGFIVDENGDNYFVHIFNVSNSLHTWMLNYSCHVSVLVRTNNRNKITNINFNISSSIVILFYAETIFREYF